MVQIMGPEQSAPHMGKLMAQVLNNLQ